MYVLGLRRSFLADHYLVGGDRGRENLPNTHRYTLELELQGENLDEHGYLVDLVEVENLLGEVLKRFAGKMLNELPEFQGKNPSLEHFAHILARELAQRFRGTPVDRLTVRLWENEGAWVRVTLPIPPAM